MEPNLLVRKLEGYAPLSDDEKSLIEKMTSENIKTYPAKSDIIADGDRPDFVHLVLDGWAARYKILHDGSRRIMAFLIPGDFCDLHITVLRQMDHGIMALSPCKVARLDSARLSELATERTNLTKALWWATLVDEAVLRQWVINAGRPALAAVAHLLCELHQRMKSIGLVTDRQLELPVTQAELAEATGMTPVHISRTLQNLRQAGLIELRAHSLFIPDIEALAETGGFDDSYLHLREGEKRRQE
ncbi:Crp/Fnr family transcriptional regulator [Aurantiacibacter poecillastricola]|uniref:Crp/Fnr family transcriptional regulator n=1 Tax=Aurantiacibacter poecillastricola TaxID=3064385 RepID=UPI00273F213C|nr:Crp/Fnr family transcriptional regulator [Aurantiacibacter sp. 219JJ12-13]MDP5262947.1 Crp/Fnr family transcriptional regulator [Aurantiacibacter sp. 219JJ12-13]